jgi:hypothetical protein
MTMSILPSLVFPILQGNPGAPVTSPGFLATAEAISSIVLGVAVLGVLVALLAVLLQLRKLARSVNDVAKRMEKGAAPVMDRAKSVAENVDFITMAIRTDVQKINASVSSLNDRLKEASVRMEERIQDFTALVEVLQNEAEDLALDTAAAVRGVRAGTKNLASEPAPRVGRAGSGALPTPDLDEKTGTPSPYEFPPSSEADDAEE